MKIQILPITLLLCMFFLPACGQIKSTDTASLEVPVHIADNSLISVTQQTEEKRSNFISSIIKEHLLPADRLTDLYRAGLEVEVISTEENADHTLLITIQIKNSNGRTLNLPVTAMLDYNTYGDGFHSETLYWGSLNIAGDELILTTLNDIYVIDTDKLDLKDISFDTTPISNNNYYLGDTVKKGDDYITSFIKEPDSKNGLILFNSNGTIKQVIETDYRFLGRIFDHTDYEPYALDLDTHNQLFFIDKEQNLLADKDYYGGSYVCNLQTGEFIYYRNIFNVPVTDGSIQLISLETPSNLQKIGEIAVLYNTEGGIKDSFQTQVPLHPSFSEYYHYYMESKNLSLDITMTGQNVFTVYNPYCAQQIVLDFTSYTAQSDYIYDSRWDCKPVATSADEKYSIVTGSYYGGGDASFQANVLLERATGKMKYIGETGGMYGGDNETGFLKNGDVYFYDYDAFNIFDTDIANTEPIWRLTDYIPMGENTGKNISYRYLMAARRDPEDKSVSIVYFDYPDVEDTRNAYADYEKDDMLLNATYHFARISQNGHIEFDYDTGVNVLLGFNLIPVSIYPENNGNMHFYGWSNSHKYIWFEGSINTQTGQYSPIKEY